MACNTLPLKSVTCLQHLCLRLWHLCKCFKLVNKPKNHIVFKVSIQGNNSYSACSLSLSSVSTPPNKFSPLGSAFWGLAVNFPFVAFDKFYHPAACIINTRIVSAYYSCFKNYKTSKCFHPSHHLNKKVFDYHQVFLGTVCEKVFTLLLLNVKSTVLFYLSCVAGLLTIC